MVRGQTGMQNMYRNNLTERHTVQVQPLQSTSVGSHVSWLSTSTAGENLDHRLHTASLLQAGSKTTKKTNMPCQIFKMNFPTQAQNSLSEPDTKNPKSMGRNFK